MSVKRAFFGIFQKLTLFCCAIFFGFANAFSANLPSGYTELEYIESTGTQYINTEIGTSSITKTEVVGQFTGLVSNTFIFGKTNGTSRYGWGEYIYPSGANKFLWNYGGWGVVTNADLNKHTFGIDTKNGLVYIDNTQFDTSQTSSAGANPAFVSDNLPIYLFARNSGGVSGYAKAKIYSVKMWNNNELTHEFVPAKYVSGSTTIYGMYDTFTGVFYQNAGTGTFTAGPVALNPCRNLFDSNGVSIQTGTAIGTDGSLSSNSAVNTCTTYIPVQPSTTYTISGNRLGSDSVYFRLAQYKSDKTFISRSENSTGERNSYTFTTGASTYYIRFHYIATADINTYQLEQGSTATAYVPFCANLIKIATTAYNTARFSPVMTDLNSTIATIRDVVTNTINQTKAIADLQAKKQTRPDEQCPAGKKCLLVEDNDGVPHWYEIIENIYGLPAGYTPLEYIEATGTQYIDTGYKPNNNTTIKTKTYITTNSNTPFGCRWSGSPEYDTFGAIVGGTGQLTVYYGRYSDEKYTPYLSYDKSIVHDIEINMDSIVYDGRSIPITRGSFASTENMYLGAFNNIGEIRNLITGRIYSTEIKESNIMVRNFVPAKNSSGVIGMYDLVNDVFYTNKGTGTFIGKEF